MKVWRYIEDDGVSAAFGLAADEFMMRYYPANQPSPAPALRLYTYRTYCALVGRFQNMEAEIDLQACQELDVQIGRRPTGGGAILMGHEQLGLCWTSPADFFKNVLRPVDVYLQFSQILSRALAKFGIQARFRPKNDLEVYGRKIAGLGVYYDPHGAMLFHTSLLVDLDVPFMLRVLKIPVEKLADKEASQSVEQRITTVCREVGSKVSLDQVRQTVKQAFEEFFQINFETRIWSEEERKQIETLAQTKYQSKDWLFQRSPQPDMEGMSLRKTPAGLIRTYIGLKGETIKSVLITGDFFEHSETLSLIESKLKWSAFTKAEIHRVVHSVLSRNGQPFKMLTTEDLTEAIWKAGLNARAKNRLTHQGACYFPEGALLME